VGKVSTKRKKGSPQNSKKGFGRPKKRRRHSRLPRPFAKDKKKRGFWKGSVPVGIRGERTLKERGKSKGKGSKRIHPEKDNKHLMKKRDESTFQTRKRTALLAILGRASQPSILFPKKSRTIRGNTGVLKGKTQRRCPAFEGGEW